MKIKTLLSLIKEDKESEFIKDEKDASKYSVKSNEEDVNFYLEQEIENIKAKWEILSYFDKNLELFSKKNENYTIEPTDIKKVTNIKRLLFGTK